MKRSRRLLSFLLALAMLASLTTAFASGEPEEAPADDAIQEAAPEALSTEEPAAEEAPAADGEPGGSDNHLTARPVGGDPGSSSDPRSATFTVSLGDSLVLQTAVTADDASGITYEWSISHDSSWSYDTLEGETGSSLSLTDIRKAALYFCTVYDRFGNVENVFFNVVIENGFSAVGPGGSQWNRVSVPYGETAHLAVNVTADDPTGITYAWFAGYDEEVLAGETCPALDVPDVTENTRYRCSVTDRFGNCEVVEFELRIDTGLIVEPIGDTEITVVPNGSVQLAVRTNAEDPDSISYQWSIEQQDPDGWFRENLLEGETNSILTLSDVTRGAHYYCKATDKYGAEASVSFAVEVENSFYAKALNGEDWMEIKLPLGGEADLTVTAGAVNAEGITYRWYTDIAYEETLGTEAALHIQNVTQTNYYECQVTDLFGSIRYVRFHVAVENGLTAIGPGGGAWNNQILAAPGDTVTLPVTATANDPEGITYEWYDTAIPLEYEGSRLPCSASALVLESVERSGSYRCLVNDKYGNTVAVEFTVEIENGFTVQAVGSPDLTVPLHGSATLAVTASAASGADFAYQWSVAPRSTPWDITPLPGETASSLVLDDVTLSGVYICEVTDAYGSSRTVEFNLSIPNNLKLVPADGKDTVIVKGGAAVLQVKATADDPEGIVYQWQREVFDPEDNSYSYVVIAGEGDRLSLTGLTEGGEYLCTATDRYGNMESAYFTVRMDGKFTASPAENDGRYYTKLHGSATLKVAAEAADPKKLSYAWYMEDENYDYTLLPGETGASLTVSDITRMTTCYCIVSNGLGDHMTVWFSVTVEDGFTLKPQGDYVTRHINPYGDDESDYVTDVYCVYAKPGEQVTLAVKAESENGGVHYTWFRADGRYEWPGGDGTSLTVTAQETATYICEAVNSYGEYRALPFRIFVDGETSVPHDEDGDRCVLPNDAALMLALGGEKTAEAALVLRMLVGLE